MHRDSKPRGGRRCNQLSMRAGRTGSATDCPCRPPPRPERRRHGVDDAMLISTAPLALSSERVGLRGTCSRERRRHRSCTKGFSGGTHAAPGVSHSQEGHHFVYAIIAEHHQSSRARGLRILARHRSPSRNVYRGLCAQATGALELDKLLASRKDTRNSALEQKNKPLYGSL